MNDFKTLGLSAGLVAALDARGLTEPTPIQSHAIPYGLDGLDVMGLAQTGTGKTLAFGLPLIHQLSQIGTKPAPKTARSLILAPTRELVNQIAENLRSLTTRSHLKITVVVGGQSINKQIGQLSKGTDILVATPGRLIDLMDRRAVELREVKHLVLDEADQMLDMGFIHALRRIAPMLGTPRQTMLFSATMPKQMEELSQAYLTKPKRVQVAPPGKAADKVSQSVHFVGTKAAKPGKLREILSRDKDALTLVFSRTKHGAEKLMKGLVADGFNAASIHGNKSQGQRDRAIAAFRAGTITTLVATDVAARGIDIPGVAYVINFDLPEVPENYIHRIGRTARAGREGEAIAFCSDEEIDLLWQIEKVLKSEVPVAGGTRPARTGQATKKKSGGGGGGRRRFGGGGGGGKPHAPRSHGSKPKSDAGGSGGAKPAGNKVRRSSRSRRRAA